MLYFSNTIINTKTLLDMNTEIIEAKAAKLIKDVRFMHPTLEGKEIIKQAIVDCETILRNSTSRPLWYAVKAELTVALHA
jgi:hypothetical protein